MRTAFALMIFIAGVSLLEAANARQATPMSRLDARRACCAEIGGRWVVNSDGSANGINDEGFRHAINLT